MNERITDKWTQTTAEAFGDTENVQKGLKAELMYYEYAKRVYPEVEYFPNDYKMQVKGVDFTIKKPNWKRPYNVDVKGNMNEKGTFNVDNKPDGWLRSTKKITDRICHVCVESGWATEYDRKDMVSWIDITNQKNHEYIYISSFDENIQAIVRRFKL